MGSHSSRRIVGVTAWGGNSPAVQVLYEKFDCAGTMIYQRLAHGDPLYLHEHPELWLAHRVLMAAQEEVHAAEVRRQQKKASDD